MGNFILKPIPRLTDIEKALIRVSYNGHAPALTALLKIGADIHTKNDAPLRVAVRRGHLEIVEILLNAGSDNIEGAMEIAIEENNIDMIVLLLSTRYARSLLENSDR